MKMYMMIYSKQVKIGENWVEHISSNHTFFIMAKDDKEAKEYAISALKKVNEYAKPNEKYVSEYNIKPINTFAVTHDVYTGTSVTGIWTE